MSRWIKGKLVGTVSIDGELMVIDQDGEKNRLVGVDDQSFTVDIDILVRDGDIVKLRFDLPVELP